MKVFQSKEKILNPLKKRGGMWKNNEKEKNWKIVVKNNKGEAIKLTVIDQIPVSGNEDIEQQFSFP
jgi:hypothetical protein